MARGKYSRLSKTISMPTFLRPSFFASPPPPRSGSSVLPAPAVAARVLCSCCETTAPVEAPKGATTARSAVPSLCCGGCTSAMQPGHAMIIMASASPRIAILRGLVVQEASGLLELRTRTECGKYRHIKWDMLRATVIAGAALGSSLAGAFQPTASLRVHNSVVRLPPHCGPCMSKVTLHPDLRVLNTGSTLPCGSARRDATTSCAAVRAGGTAPERYSHGPGTLEATAGPD